MNCGPRKIQKSLVHARHLEAVSLIILNLFEFDAPGCEFFGRSLIPELKCIDNNVLLLFVVGKDPEISFDSVEVVAAKFSTGTLVSSKLLALGLYDRMVFAVWLLSTEEKEYLIFLFIEVPFIKPVVQIHEWTKTDS